MPHSEDTPMLAATASPPVTPLVAGDGNCTVASPGTRLFDRLREALRSRHYSRRTEASYCQWVKRLVFFHSVRNPAEMGEPEINAFLSHLAIKGKVSASTQNQALSALLFLYRKVLAREIGDLGCVIRARRPKRLPVVLTRDEVKAALANLTGDKWLMGGVMYGAVLRVSECLGLRVHDLDFSTGQIMVRDGKGFKDRLTMLPEVVKTPLRQHLARVHQIHQRDLAAGYGRVSMPSALARKYPTAARDWGWQWVFPQEHRWVNCATGEQGRHHVDESILQGREGRRAAGRYCEARYMPYVSPFIRYPSAGGGL
jgi:integron integrase